MSKEYLGWRGVIKLAKELDYSWQEACEVLYRKNVRLN
jgi:putative transposon-encoded protein